MNKNIMNKYEEHKQCAYMNCNSNGTKKLQILYIHKEGWFCEKCGSKLISEGLIKSGAD